VNAHQKVEGIVPKQIDCMQSAVRLPSARRHGPIPAASISSSVASAEPGASIRCMIDEKSVTTTPITIISTDIVSIELVIDPAIILKPSASFPTLKTRKTRTRRIARTKPNAEPPGLSRLGTANGGSSMPPKIQNGANATRSTTFIGLMMNFNVLIGPPTPSSARTRARARAQQGAGGWARGCGGGSGTAARRRRALRGARRTG
jgi:hypothetical protein